MEDPLNAISRLKAGTVKALAITGTIRSPAIPEIPTMAEAGLKDYALRDRLTAQGLEVVGGSVQQFADFVRRDTERWRGAVAASGAKID